MSEPSLSCDSCEHGLLLPLTCARCRANIYRCDERGCVYTDLFGPLEQSSWQAPTGDLRYARCPCCSHEALMPLRQDLPEVS